MVNHPLNASAKPPLRRDETTFGNVRDFAVLLAEILKVKSTCEAEIEIGNKITIVTHQDAEGTIEKTIFPVQSGVRQLGPFLAACSGLQCRILCLSI